MKNDPLIELALQATDRSYSPYSQKKVGAAIRIDSGETYTGSNVENASFGATICAERSAIVRAISTHGPNLRIKEIAVATPSELPWAPCGMCLQVIAEFSTSDTSVTLVGSSGTTEVTTLGELLPRAFSRKEMTLSTDSPY